MRKELVKLANHLDRIGLVNEADYLDFIIKSTASNRAEKRKEKERLGFIKRMDRYFDDKAKDEALEEMSGKHFLLGISSGYFADRGMSAEELKPFVELKLIDQPIRHLFKIYMEIKSGSDAYEGLISEADIRKFADLYVGMGKMSTSKYSQEDFIVAYKEGLFSFKKLESYINFINISIDNYPIGEILMLHEKEKRINE